MFTLARYLCAARGNMTMSEPKPYDPNDNIHSLVVKLPPPENDESNKHGIFRCTASQYIAFTAAVMVVSLCSAAFAGLAIWMRVLSGRENCALSCGRESPNATVRVDGMVLCDGTRFPLVPRDSRQFPSD